MSVWRLVQSATAQSGLDPAGSVNRRKSKTALLAAVFKVSLSVTYGLGIAFKLSCMTQSSGSAVECFNSCPSLVRPMSERFRTD